jgi:hypothetical protein
MKHINSTLIEQGGIVISSSNVDFFNTFMNESFKLYLKESKEPIKVEFL